MQLLRETLLNPSLNPACNRDYLAALYIALCLDCGPEHKLGIAASCAACGSAAQLQQQHSRTLSSHVESPCLPS